MRTTLPLNVSREILQQNRQLERIKAACVKRVLDLIEKLARDEPEKFATFYKAFGQHAERRHQRRRQQPRAHRQAAALRQHQR